MSYTEINFCAYPTRQQPPYIREISGKNVYSAVFAWITLIFICGVFYWCYRWYHQQHGRSWYCISHLSCKGQLAQWWWSRSNHSQNDQIVENGGQYAIAYSHQFSRQFRRNACVALTTWLSRTQQVTSHPWQPCRNCWGVIKATNLTICSPMLSILECSRACFWEVVSWLSLLRFESLAISTWLKLAIFAWRYLVISARPEQPRVSAQ